MAVCAIWHFAIRLRAALSSLIVLLGRARARNIKLGYLYTQNGPGSANNWGASWVQESFSQFKLGILDVNANTSILPNDTLSFDLVDSEGQESTAFEGAMDLLNSGVIGIVGTGYSSALAFPAGYCSFMKKPIVSPGSTLIELNDKARFPYLLRSIANDAGILKGMVALIFDLQWRKSAILANEQLEFGVIQVIRPAMVSSGIDHLSIMYSSPDDSNGQPIQTNRVRLNANMELIKISGYRIICAYMKTSDLAGVNETATTAGIGFQALQYVWVMNAEGFVGSAHYQLQVLAATLTSSRSALEVWYDTRWPSVTTLWNATLHGGYNSSTGLPFFGPNASTNYTVWDTDYANIGDGKPDVWGKFVYDTVWLYAYALHAMTLVGKDINDGKALRNELLASSVVGITGPIVFDQLYQDRLTLPSFDMSSITIGAHQVGTATTALGAWTFNGPCSGCTMLTSASLTWPGGQIPSDGRALDVMQSSTFMAQTTFPEGGEINLIVQARNSFGRPPCENHCSNTSAAVCVSCLASFAVYQDITPIFRDITNGKAAATPLVAAPLIHEVQVATGRVRIRLPSGLNGAGILDRTVTLQVTYGSAQLQGGSYVLQLQSTSCIAGLYGTAGNCMPCKAGKFTPFRGALTCTLCAGGFYQDQDGASTCIACGTGRYSLNGSSLCTFCERGRFSGTVADITCSNCTLGKTTHQIASVSEKACVCDVGRYLNNNMCITCPTGSTTKTIGRTSLSSCLCQADTFLPSHGGACNQCPIGMTCARGSSEDNYVWLSNATLMAVSDEQQYPRLVPGHGSSTSDPLKIFKCRSDSKCIGGDPGRVCAAKLREQACEHCNEGFHWDGKKCTTCGGLEQSWFMFPFLPMLFMPILVCLMYKIFRDPYEHWGSWQAGCSATVFITLSYYQSLNLLTSASIKWPKSMFAYLDWWSFSNAAPRFFKTDCYGFMNYRNMQMIQVAAPAYIVISGVLCMMGSWSLARMMDRPRIAMEPNRLFNVFGSIMLTFSNAIASVSMMLFKCVENPEPNDDYSLSSDLSVTCYKQKWLDMMGVAVVATIIYCVGMISIIVRIIWIARARFNCERFQMRWKFLFIRYRSDVHWFSLVFVAKNLLLNAGYAFLSSGIAQLTWMMTIISVYSLLVALVLPYRNRTANALEIPCCLCLLCACTLLMWFADRGPNNGATYGNRIQITIVAVSMLPCFMGVCVITFLVNKYRIRVRQLKRYQEGEGSLLHAAVTALATLGEARGIEFYMNLSEWDRWFSRKFVAAIEADLLGITNKRASFVRTRQNRYDSWMSATPCLNSLQAFQSMNDVCGSEVDTDFTMKFEAGELSIFVEAGETLNEQIMEDTLLEKGMAIKAVDGKPFTMDILCDTITSGMPYELTFQFNDHASDAIKHAAKEVPQDEVKKIAQGVLFACQAIGLEWREKTGNGVEKDRLTDFHARHVPKRSQPQKDDQPLVCLLDPVSAPWHHVCTEREPISRGSTICTLAEV